MNAGDEPVMGHFDASVAAVVRVCDWVCRLSMLVMMVLVAAEIIGRALLGISLQLSDELGGYLLVAIAFLSLPVCQSQGAFHQVTFVHDRLTPGGRIVLTLFLETASLMFALVLVWQLFRLETTTFSRADQSDTLLMAPLWIPRLPMVIGSAALSLTLVHSISIEVRKLMRHQRS